MYNMSDCERDMRETMRKNILRTPTVEVLVAVVEVLVVVVVVVVEVLELLGGGRGTGMREATHGSNEEAAGALG